MNMDEKTPVLSRSAAKVLAAYDQMLLDKITTSIRNEIVCLWPPETLAIIHNFRQLLKSIAISQHKDYE